MSAAELRALYRALEQFIGHPAITIHNVYLVRETQKIVAAAVLDEEEKR